MPPRPVIAVIGTTGVGKSNYAVSLARALASLPTSPGSPPFSSLDAAPGARRRGVILSADSMQLYAGLDVITNKITPGEARGVEHWGVGVVKPGEGGAWEIGRWISEAERRIADMPPTEVPIICGGTHYYTQHLLFPPAQLSTVRDQDRETTSALRWTPPGPLPALPADFDPTMKRYLETFYLPDPVYPPGSASAPSTSRSMTPTGSHGPSRPTLTDSNELLALHRLLTAVDPDEAQRWHWRDGRKVRRAIERWWEAGQAQEVAQGETPSESAPEEFKYRSLVFWVYEPLESLSDRLDARVDKMVTQGLLDEIKALRAEARRIYGSEDNADCEEGIFQAIGYKEFAAIPTADLAPSHPHFKACLDRMKLSTRQYARRQLKWVQKQFLPAVRAARARGEEVHVVLVHGGERDLGVGVEAMRAWIEKGEAPVWDEIGHEDAKALLKDVFAKDRPAGLPGPSERRNLLVRTPCPICSTADHPVTLSAAEWPRHEASRAHRKAKIGKERGEVDYSAVREEAARRKAAKEQEARAGLDRDETGDVGG